MHWQCSDGDLSSSSCKQEGQRTTQQLNAGSSNSCMAIPAKRYSGELKFNLLRELLHCDHFHSQFFKSSLRLTCIHLYFCQTWDAENTETTCYPVSIQIPMEKCKYIKISLTLNYYSKNFPHSAQKRTKIVG